jgi:hypothetical protein
MNNRIFELAKQVELIQWDKLPSGAITPDHGSVVKAKRFAELIVRECISLRTELTQFDSTDPYGDGYENGLKDMAELMAEHFGVEE